VISCFCVVLFPGIINSQINTSVTNLFRYGDGNQTIIDNNIPLIYRENLTDVKFRLPHSINAGFRLLYDVPPEVGLEFKGVSRKFIEYTNEDLYVRAGDYSELYGKGLAVNLFENRGLAYDTWAEGLKASYKSGGLDASLIYGNIEFTDSINFWRTEEYVLTGGNFEYRFSKFLTAGFSYVAAEGTIPLVNRTYNLKAEIPEVYITLKALGFNWYFNWVQKWTNVIDEGTISGRAIYSSLSYSIAGLGITIDYKDYLFDEQDPFTRNDFTRPTRMLPFQNPPIVQKEHSYTFQSRAIHEVDFNDEVGFQIELFYSLTENTFLNFNGSLSSRHNYYSYNGESFSFTRMVRMSNFLPSTDDKYSPYWEAMLEIEQTFSSSTAANIGIAARKKVLYNEISGNVGSHIINSTVIPFFGQHTFTEDFSMVFQYEFEAVSDNFNTQQEEYSNHFISLIGNFFAVFNLNFRYEITTNKYDLSGKNNWFTVEAGYRIGYYHNIAVSYGSERGGQTCSNGICRYILPFEGFKFTLLSNI
jgi:hypothetical protein